MEDNRANNWQMHGTLRRPLRGKRQEFSHGQDIGNWNAMQLQLPWRWHCSWVLLTRSAWAPWHAGPLDFRYKG
eukprot:137809-Lingulodinium_polyedra.AAC.1